MTRTIGTSKVQTEIQRLTLVMMTITVMLTLRYQIWKQDAKLEKGNVDIKSFDSSMKIQL